MSEKPAVAVNLPDARITIIHNRKKEGGISRRERGQNIRSREEKISRR